MDDFRQVTSLDQATGDDTLRLARTAAEAIRGLNWLTRCEAGLGQPSIAAAAVFLGDARMSAAALAGDLDAAQQQLALINGTPRSRTRKEQS